MGNSRIHRFAFGFFLVAGALIVSIADVEAIPVFARKYNTSCQTCHITYPRLTPFGETYRLNGFRWPEGKEAEVRQEEAVQLGAAAYKRLWPKSVWPGSIPGTPPLALLIASETAYRPDDPEGTQFTAMEAELLAGGNAGGNVSFYGEVAFELDLETDETEVAVERAYAAFLPWVKPVFNVKVGQFEPGIALISNHRRQTGGRYWYTRPPAGVAGSGAVVLDNEFRLESPAQNGMELWGVFAHRVLWNAGIVEGKFNDQNSSKDVYARIAGKWGGLRWDGTTPEDGGPEMQNPQPWREMSFAASTFAYQGSADIDATAAEFQDDFSIYGVDFQVNLKDFIFNAGISKGNNDNPDLSGTFTDVDSEVNFIEATWVAYPWLVPVLRYETYELTDGFADDKRVRWVPTVNVLIRANVLAFLAAEIERERFGDFSTEVVEGGLVIAF